MGALVELNVENVSLVRGERLVVRSLSFRVPAGQTLALSGPNGVGKTSVLRAIAGLLDLHSGRIAISLGRGGAIETADDRGSVVGWIGHQDAAKPQLTPLEQLCFHQRYHRCAGDIGGALERAGVSRLRHLPAQYLSAGQKRRLALARLILCPRPLWLLDEPFSALDAQGKELVRELIKAHCDDGGVVVAATHEALGLQCAMLELQ